MIGSIYLLISIIGWIFYTLFVYGLFLVPSKNSRYKYYNDVINNIFPNFYKLDVYLKISTVLTFSHAMISLLASIYFFINYDSENVLLLSWYHIVVGISLTYYITDLLIVYYFVPDYIYVGHHIAAIIVISIYYCYSHIFPHMYSLGMILAEITNPFQLMFTYLLKTKQTKTKRFFVSSTVFTFIFTYIRCIVVPFLYWKIYHTGLVKLTDEVHPNMAMAFNIANIGGLLGGGIWTYNLIIGYYKKIYKPMFEN